MKKVYSIKCNKYGKPKNSKTSNIFREILVLPIIYCSKKDTIYKKEETTETKKILGLIV